MSGARRRLQDLDRRVLPTAARALRAGLDRVDRLTSRARSGARTAGRRVGRVEDRLTASGPLALLRDVPQIGLLVVAAVFLAGTAAAVYLDGEDVPRTIGATSPPTPVGRAQLGLAEGEPVDPYLQRASGLVEQLADRRPDGRYLALVSLDRHVPATELATLLEGTETVRVYLQAPGVERAETVEVPLAGTTAPTVLPALCTATAARKSDDARELRNLAETIEVRTPDEQAQKDDYVAEADRAAAEGAAYAGPCATAFAAVVEGEAQDLAALLERDGVRGVEVAPAGARLADVDVSPVVPA